jgi:hypothetical protein
LMTGSVALMRARNCSARRSRAGGGLKGTLAPLVALGDP